MFEFFQKKIESSNRKRNEENPEAEIQQGKQRNLSMAWEPNGSEEKAQQDMILPAFTLGGWRNSAAYFRRWSGQYSNRLKHLGKIAAASSSTRKLCSVNELGLSLLEET